ncbi:AldA [Caligus rogercresseyi]|uniref:AldA n=1 Tax=Caligus rogercresseyi TaxID=217165 RepID=A0A7T8KA84_CALRO|nr:AldA [Caligus rogercresseyi]
MHLELGGKNPVIVFDDADLDRALDAVIFMIYSINGERCTSSSRLLVQDTIRAEFEAKLAARVNNIKVGHPLDPATEIGPLISDEHYAKVTSEQEALAIANDTDYGLTGYVWTHDLTRALRFTDQLEAGMIWVNSEKCAPFANALWWRKSSGIGRDGGDWSFEFYMEQKHIGFATGQHKITRLGALD